VINALLAILPAWPDLAGVAIRDGQQTPDVSATGAVFIGDTQQLDDAGQPVENAADYLAQSEGLGGNRSREQFSIHCCAAFLDTNGSYGNARKQAYALANAAGAAIEAHSNGLPVNGSNTIQGQAGMSGGSLKYVKTDAGVKAVVLFDVDVTSYTP
jgi:hypothetical protein